MVRSWCVLYILTWKCASRHNGVHFFISHLASCLRTRRFSEPTFRPSGATNHWKNTVNRDFPTFSRICIFFLLIFSLLTLLTSAFQLSILSEVSLLNFLRSYKHILTVFSLSSMTSMGSYPVFHRWGLRCHAEFLPFFDFPMILTQDRPQISQVHFFSHFICQSHWRSKGNQRKKNRLGFGNLKTIQNLQDGAPQL